MVTQAKINSRIIGWARERAHLTADELAQGTGVKLDQLIAWESGAAHPTFRQAQSLASAAHIPFGFLFLPQPPEEQLPLPDLRTVGGSPLPRPSVDLMDTVRNALHKQTWFQEYANEHGREPLPFVGAYTVESSVQNVVGSMREVLPVDPRFRRGSGDEYLGALVAAADRAGVLVLRNGIVGNNVHRKLDVSEFRGFAIADPLVPVVFINNADALKARLFTLLHELAHIWTGSSGVSGMPSAASRREERFCNAVAGEFLAPEAEFRAQWDGQADWRENLRRLTAVFHVSNLVVARRARDLGYIDEQTHSDYYLAELEAFRKSKKAGGGGYANTLTRNGRAFSEAVTREAMSGRLLMRDASRLLGLQPASLRAYARELGL